MTVNTEECILCGDSADLFFYDTHRNRQYFHCKSCDLRFVGPSSRLDYNGERNRYLKHNNDIHDPNYQSFVSPLYNIIKENINPTAKGLDFGCGEGPVLSHLLSCDGYDVTLYDPIFRADANALLKKYDFIFCVEVAEHFYNPREEFLRLKKLSASNGQLFFMTTLFSQEIQFSTWNYRSDPTHVSFYSNNTFEWIKENFKFKNYKHFSNRIVQLETI